MGDQKKVYKYGIEDYGVSIVRMPVGAELLSVGFQGGSIKVWARVDVGPDVADASRIIEVVGTGEPLSDEGADRIFIGSMFYAELVFHVFDLGELK